MRFDDSKKSSSILPDKEVLNFLYFYNAGEIVKESILGVLDREGGVTERKIIFALTLAPGAKMQMP